MIWVLVAISVIIVALGFIPLVIADRCDCDDDICGSLTIGIWLFGAICFLASLIAGIVLSAKLTGEIKLNKQLENYTEENIKLEQQIDIVVKSYLEHEEIVYENWKDIDGTTLLLIIPELSSREVVGKQLDILYQNNSEIKNLKNELAKISQVRWWVTFKY